VPLGVALLVPLLIVLAPLALLAQHQDLPAVAVAAAVDLVAVVVQLPNLHRFHRCHPKSCVDFLKIEASWGRTTNVGKIDQGAKTNIKINTVNI
jgi:hypothetical protein